MRNVITSRPCSGNIFYDISGLIAKCAYLNYIILIIDIHENNYEKLGWNNKYFKIIALVLI